MEYLPWNNSRNIATMGQRVIVSQFRTNILVILFLIGGPANVINMAVFAKQGLKDRVNLLLFSLSLADEMCLISAMLLYVDEFYLQFTGETEMGPILIFIVNEKVSVLQGMYYVSFALSAIIACERCYCVLRPLSYHTLLRTRTVAIIVLAVYIVILTLFFLVVSRFYIGCLYDLDTRVQTVQLVDSQFYLDHKELIDNIDIVVFGAGLPSGIMVVVVTTTLITITRLRQAVAWRAESAAAVVSAKEIALTKMLVGISILLIVCVSPVSIFRLARYFLPEVDSGRRHENLSLICLWVSQVFMYINSSFNIFVYLAMGSRYRETLWALCRRKEGQTTRPEVK